MANGGREMNGKLVHPEGSESEEGWRHELIAGYADAVRICMLDAVRVKKLTIYNITSALDSAVYPRPSETLPISGRGSVNGQRMDRWRFKLHVAHSDDLSRAQLD